MPNIAVTSKETQQLLLSADTNTVTLSENSVVKIDTAIEDVASITREGNAAIVNLKNGEKVVIESYFDDPLDSHHIVFDNGEQLYWAEFANAAGEILPTIKYHFIETISPLLYADTLAALMPWVTGAVAAGATIAAVGSDSDSASSNTPVDSTAAEQLVIAAEEAQQAAEDLLNQAQEDGLITSEEQAQLQDAADAAAEAKDTAQDAVTALPESADKEELQDRLDNLEGISVPPVTDADGNGKDDAVEAAEALVTDAENAHQAAEDVIAGAQEDGLITPAEQQAIQDAVDAATEAEQMAQDAVTALPESTDKDGLQDRLDNLTDIVIPAVTDTDGNGIDDTVDAQIADAEAAVKAAEDAYQAAEDALEEANANGLITPTEKAELEEALKAAQDAKDAAQDAVDALPSSPAAVQDAKDGFQDRIDALTDIIIPAVNDANENGVDDSTENPVDLATDLVEAAEDAYQAAEDALTDANTDGLITPEEKAALEDALKDAQDAKDAAQNAVDALPDSTDKDALQDRIDALTDITVPAVTDTDGNGIDDAVDAQIADTEAAVKAAEDAYQAAEDALEEANANGLITPTEKAELEEALKAAQDAKDAAQDAVNALPSSPAAVQDAKDGFQDRIDALTDITVPAVTDTDGNGIDDTVDAQIADAEAAVKAAEDAYQAAEDALEEANANGLITPTEKAELEEALKAAQDAKDAAQDAVDALPSSPAAVQDAKDGFQDHIDALTDIIIPAVNDANENGVDDSTENPVDLATDLVEAAEDAYQAAEDALTDANTDGLITPEEKAALEDALKDAQDAKDAAQNAVDALPDSTDKDALQDRIDALTDITVPAVTDTDGNGIDDAVDAQIADTEAAVKAAEDAYDAAADALAAALDNDGVYSQAEVDALSQNLADAQAAKDAAQDAVDALPSAPAAVQDAKDDFQDRINALTDIVIPAVNDADTDGNGIADVIDGLIADAEAAVKAAEDAYDAAADALAAALDNDGVYSQAEVDALSQNLADAQAAKDAAQDAVDALPSAPAAVQDAKDDFQDRINALTDIVIPAVNDADTDGNGIADVIDGLIADAEAAVKAAEDAYDAAADALAAALDNDGVYSQAEVDALSQNLADAQAAKDAAQDAVDALPSAPAAVQDAKDDFQDRINALTDIVIPAVNDADTDGNGIADVIDGLIADAEAAVKAAEDAYDAAADALAAALDNDGVYSQAEVDALSQNLADAQAAKDAAQDAVDALPSAPAAVQDAKDDFQDRINALTDIVIPAVSSLDLLAVNNDAQVVLQTTGAPVELTPEQSLVGNKATSFGVASIGLGGLADVGALDFGSYLDVTVDQNQTRELTFKADGGGISIGEAHDLVVLKQDQWGNWNVVQMHKDWFVIGFLGEIKNGAISIEEPGNYKVYLSKTNGVGVLSGSGLEIIDDKVFDNTNIIEMSGAVSGNVLTDINNHDDQIGTISGQDIYSDTVIIDLIQFGTESSSVDQSMETSIQGLYGTLVIAPNGDYTYTLNEGALPALGTVETFNYTLKDQLTGQTSTADLNIILNTESKDLDPVIQTLTVNTQPVVVPVETPLADSEQVNIASVGLGIADVKVATIETGMEINVAEGHTREISFSSSGGAPVAIGATPVSLAIYKFNEQLQNWELYALKENWYTIVGAVVGAGVSQENLDILFTEGQYRAVTLSTTAGVSVLPMIVLKADTDTLYDHTQVETSSETLEGQLIQADHAGFQMKSVNGVDLTGTQTIQGKFGSLTINLDGSYVYIVTPGISVDFDEVETFVYTVKNPTTGELASGTLNIQLDTIQAIDDVGSAGFGVDNVEDYTAWNVSESGAGTQTFTQDILVATNQILDLKLVYTLNQLGSQADQYLIQLLNKDTGDVIETHLDQSRETGNATGTWDLNLNSGNYTLKVVVDGYLTYVNQVTLSLTGTVTTLDQFAAEPTNHVNMQGDLFDNDTFANASEIVIQGKTLIVDRMGAYDHSDQKALSFQGQHGVLTVKEDGTYVYQASGESYGIDEFTYTLHSLNGTSQTATLTMNVGKNISSSQYNDIISGSQAADNLIFKLLSDTDTGGNGHDVWTDFNATEGDSIDISALLSEQSVTSETLGNFVTLEQRGEHTVVTIDRDGSATDTTYAKTDLIILENTTASNLVLDDLIKYNQI
ncbi:BapA/Bap/LapF family large adhesin [Acinetobacter indicus]|uniref:BapA/Bap/LapF family large adhesin n=1 Tax=Acinetobacter indicus TaxID=756892 RepID=UPI0035BBA59E